jgi:hypothetical protein
VIQVSNNGERLDVFSQMPSGKRLLLALFGLIPLLAPYELMLRVQWNDYGHPAFLLAAVISAGAVVLSALFMFAALAGLSSRMTLDAARSTFTYSTGAPIVPHRRLVLPLSSLESVRVRTHEWSDGAPTYTLMVTMSDGATFESGSAWSREDIEQEKTRVEGFLDRAKRSR